MTTMMMRPVRAAAALAIAGLMGMTIAPRRADAQQRDVALVYRLLQEGQMLVIPSTGDRHAAVIGERLRDRDVVATSANTRAALRFTDDGSILRVNPNSQVRLTAGDERGVLVRTLNLEFGEVWARVTHHQGTTLRVQTPAGVAAVKGTEFVVQVARDGTTTVITLEGVVEFFNQAGRVDVPAGRKVTVDSATRAPQAVPATAEDVRRATDVRGDEGGGTANATWIEVQLQDAAGRTRTLMLQVPADAVRDRVEGRP
ncbi:MAG: FecR domain-containing protein [Gemmatimonadetes bacterium]|nr:FecR domain-containing protein [Gemmatimonadota bacterium]